jgi:hypothetical protein
MYITVEGLKENWLISIYSQYPDQWTVMRLWTTKISYDIIALQLSAVYMQVPFGTPLGSCVCLSHFSFQHEY